ncbi:hypothetical protein L208DRAFT_1382975 [Tricholoma matsutake]|nr:hypothetical protein L208DRAFT_1382975 [Tricholoma matsutake 945]
MTSWLQWTESRKTLERITRLALQLNKHHAKFAAHVLAISTNGEEACMNIVEAIVEGFFRGDVRSASDHSMYFLVKYVQFYLNLIVTSDNVSLLYHLAMKGKTIRDSESHTFMESWSIQSYPGKVRLPSDILQPLPSAEVANKILKTIYLPEETLSWLSELSKNSKVKLKFQEKKECKPLGKRKAPVTKANGYSKLASTRKRK